MIAGGIGITPFLSVFRHFRHLKAHPPSTFFWANNTNEDLFALEELQELSAILDLKIVVVLLQLSDADVLRHAHPALHFEQGYLTAELMAKYVHCSPISVYLCGSKNMQEFVQSQLLKCGITPDHIEKEMIGGYLKK